VSRRPHEPVLLAEVTAALAEPAAGGGWVLDGTLGAGGHAEPLLEALPAARLLGLDRDPDALALADERLARFGDRCRLVHAAYADAPAVVADVVGGPLAGALLDLGVSSMQLDRPERGFSFQADGPLDMRMDGTGGETAADLVGELPEGELADLIYQLGEERASRRIARAIVEARARGPIETTGQLAQVIADAGVRTRRPRRRTRKGRPPPRLHPATKTFQALRLAVNDELGQLERGLPALFELLAPGGRLAVIAFHSLEDRISKRFFRARKQAGDCRVLTKKPTQAGEEEVARNPRARSAKLRVGERVAPEEAAA